MLYSLIPNLIHGTPPQDDICDLVRPRDPAALLCDVHSNVRLGVAPYSTPKQI